MDIINLHPIVLHILHVVWSVEIQRIMSHYNRNPKYNQTFQNKTKNQTYDCGVHPIAKPTSALRNKTHI